MRIENKTAAKKGAKYRPVHWHDMHNLSAGVIGWGIEEKQLGKQRYVPVWWKGEIHPFASKKDSQVVCDMLNAEVEPMPLQAWSARHGFTYNTAAAALGVSRSTYRRLLHKSELPKLVQRSMKQIEIEGGVEVAEVKQWTVARYPNGSWDTGGRPDDACYEGCEVFVVQARSRDEAKQRAQAERRKRAKLAMKRIDDEKGMK